MFTKSLSIKSILFIFTLMFVPLTAQSNEHIEAELDSVIAANKGKVIYLDFWASWCKPCRKSFPWMNKMQAKYGESGLVVLSVNLDAEKTFATEFLNEVPADFDVLYDPKGVTARKLKVQGMPSSYLIDKNGQFVSAHRGFNDDKKVKYEQEIQALLNNITAN